MSAHKLACDTNGVNEGAAIWLLHFFMKRLAAAALDVCITLCSKWHRLQMEGTVKTYCEAVNILLETYETEDVIAETNADMMHFTPLSNKFPTEYAEAL